jgi:hypothetical protein
MQILLFDFRVARFNGGLQLAFVAGMSSFWRCMSRVDLVHDFEVVPNSVVTNPDSTFY